jgi:cell wall assembly regulator SMI1
MNYTSLSSLISNNPDIEHGVGATVEEIRAAEESLGVVFPQSLKMLLREFGWLARGPDEFYGLGRDVPDHLHLVRITNRERTRLHPSLPTCLLPVLNDGAGNLACLKVANDAAEDASVVWWQHERGQTQEPVVCDVSFVHWLEQRLREAER